MDNAFWQAIIENDYAVPTGNALDDLTEQLIAILGDTDPEVREGPGYTVLENWIERGVYTPDALRAMADRMVANLRIGLGEPESDSVFRRTFSMLILTEILKKDNGQPFLTEAEVRRYMEDGIAYLREEQDVRGYVAGKGWAHAVAHTSDLFGALARSRFMQAVDLERLLQACVDKLYGPTSRVYLYEEDERLAYAVLTALRRNLLQYSFLTGWIARFAQADDNDTFFLTAEQAMRCHNLKVFLRSLYFQLRLATAAPPQDAQRILAELEKGIQAMDHGFYALP